MFINKFISKVFQTSFVTIYLLPFLLFSIITSIVIFSWFRYGYLYGGGDVGLPSYDPARTFEITKNIWWEASAPGTTVPHGLTSVPLQYFQSILQDLELPVFAIQAIVFWILFFLSGYGMYLLGLNVFGRNKFYLAIFTGLFYIFNPYMMVQIWHRFIHNAFFLSAALPFLFIFFRSWVQTGKYSALLLFLLTNFIAVYLYGTIAFIATILTLLLLIYIIEVLFPWKGLPWLRFVTSRLFFGIIMWLAIHSWWLLPVLNVAPVVLSSQHSVVDNLSTLLSISSQTIIPYSLLGINPFYLYQEADFGKIFDTYFFRSLPWLSLIFLVPGFMMALKNRKWAFWSLLAVAGIFLSKGATSPFGFPYIFGFSNFFPLGVLRNPFEKLGILIPFSYAILFSIGIEWYLEKVGSKFKFISKLGIAVILILILIVDLWPMWLGKMFGKYDKQAFIQVPSSYAEADRYIKNQNNQSSSTNKTGRILHLPLTVDESVTYNWKYGYIGVEPSQLLFKSLPSISHGFNQGIVDDSLAALSQIFSLPYTEDKILVLLQSFNTQFIVLHKDIEWRGGYLQDPQKLEARLDGLNFLDNKIQFGDLIIYELKDEYFNPKIKLTNNIQYLIPSEGNSYWPWLLSLNKGDLISSIKEDSQASLIETGAELIVFPKQTYNYSPQIIVKENLLGEMPAVKILPDSFLYILIRIKEKIQYFTSPAREKFALKVTFAGKRLIESYQLKEKGSTKSIVSLLREYRQVLPEIKEGTKERIYGKERENEVSATFIISRHLATLNLIEEITDNDEKQAVLETKNKLSDFMKETNISPLFPIQERDDFSANSRLISRFNIPISGKYELLQAHQQIRNIYPNNMESNLFQINNEIKDLKGVLSDNFIAYGMIDLQKGFNEISFISVPSINLIKLDKNETKGNVVISNDEIEITSYPHDSSYIEFNIEPVNGGDWYQLNLESLIQLGDKFRVEVFQDTDIFDPKNPKEQLPVYFKDFTTNPYENYWNGRYFMFYINPATTKAKIRFIVSPWDGCRYFQSREFCLNKDYKYQYQKFSKTSFRNINVVRSLSNPIFLRAKLPNKINSLEGKIVFSQNNMTSYSGSFNLNSGAFLIFNETYHTGWELKLFNKGKAIPSQKYLSNLYGNAWYIENPGDYNFNLEFTPEENIKRGITISTICLLILIILIVKQKFKK